MSDPAIPADGAQPALERRLATILSADVAGYSRLMGEDEERTVQTLRGHRAVFDALLKQHHGRSSIPPATRSLPSSRAR